MLCDLEKQPLRLLIKYDFISELGRENICVNLNTALLKADKFLQMLYK